MPHDLLPLLEQTLHREMPICQAMGFRATSWDGDRLAMQMPLTPNRNHQDSAFAGSLNALCTAVGWGSVFLRLHQRGLTGNIVIRRSTIRYLRPVRIDPVRAASLSTDPEHVDYFFELLLSKGRSKIDCDVLVEDQDGPYLSFHGSYVVQDCLPVKPA
jgi:thioesterase domain-containing protein